MFHRQTFHRFVTRTHLHPSGNATMRGCTSFPPCAVKK
nr:MAG TPA: MIOREX complex component 7 [Bacteriophage sp.]